MQFPYYPMQIGFVWARSQKDLVLGELTLTIFYKKRLQVFLRGEENARAKLILFDFWLAQCEASPPANSNH
jgi:hypothetical protein